MLPIDTRCEVHPRVKYWRGEEGKLAFSRMVEHTISDVEVATCISKVLSTMHLASDARQIDDEMSLAAQHQRSRYEMSKARRDAYHAFMAEPRPRNAAYPGEDRTSRSGELAVPYPHNPMYENFLASK